MVTWKSFFTSIVVGLVLAGAGLAQGTVSNARYCRQFRVTAAAASATKALDLAPTSPSTPSPATLRCQSIQIRNEATTSGDDAYINLETTTAAATDADQGTNIRILAGEAISIDGRFSNIAFIRSGANSVTLRVIVIY